MQLQSEAERFVEALQTEGEGSEEVKDEKTVANLKEELQGINGKVRMVSCVILVFLMQDA
jgi:hypothetical protein